MPANRFYLDADLSSKETLLLEGNEYHHLAHVMRQKTGDIIELVDGKGLAAFGAGSLRSGGFAGGHVGFRAKARAETLSGASQIDRSRVR